MLRYLNSLTIASVIIILAMGVADFIMSDRIDLARLSGAACAPILTLAIYRWATKSPARAIIRRK